MVKRGNRREEVLDDADELGARDCIVVVRLGGVAVDVELLLEEGQRVAEVLLLVAIFAGEDFLDVEESFSGVRSLS